MTNTQKKALQHASAVLKSIETAAIYSATISAMIDEGIDNETRSRIWAKITSVVYSEFSKAKDAKDWIDGIISDI